jgi:hypothetical protein
LPRFNRNFIPCGCVGRYKSIKKTRDIQAVLMCDRQIHKHVSMPCPCTEKMYPLSKGRKVVLYFQYSYCFEILYCLALLDPSGEIGSVCQANVYSGNRPLRHLCQDKSRRVLYLILMFIDYRLQLMVASIQDQNTWNIEQ